MRAKTRVIVNFAMLAVIAAGCGSDKGGGSRSHVYKLALSGPAGRAIAGIAFSVSDPSTLIKRAGMKSLYPPDGFPIWEVSPEGSPPVWRFALLRKRGALADGDLFEIKTDDVLHANVIIEQACDTAGTPIDVSGISLALRE